MSTTMTVEFQSIPGTEAALGVAGSHSLVADRPVGKAGGLGIGFNGGQLLALAIGGCLCNDLRYVAHQRGASIKALNVSVSVAFDGQPLLATAADIQIRCELEDGGDPASLIEEARASSTVANSLQRGMAIRYD